MKVVIVGAGLVGTMLARHIISSKGDVVLIERNEDKARHASNRLDCMVIREDGNSLAVLEEAGLAKADALVCVTDSDEINMITCGLAATKFQKPLKIARVRNPEYSDLGGSGASMPGVDVFVHPDVEAARAVLKSVEHGALGDVISFGDTPYELATIEVAASCPVAGKTVREFRELAESDCLVVLIERGEESLIPTGRSVVLEGDRVRVLVREQEVHRIFALAGRKARTLRRIAVVGGGKVGSLVVEGLSDPSPSKIGVLSRFLPFLKPKNAKRLLVIEKDIGLCKQLSGRFPDALVLNEDISDEGFLADEDMENLDLVVTATEDQELNMIAGIYLKKRGVDRTIALVSGSGYTAIARELGIDVVVPLKDVVVDTILSHLRGEAVRSVHRVAGGNIEIMELEIPSESPIIGQRLESLRFPQGTLVMLVVRSGSSFIPSGDCVFESSDRVVTIVRRGQEVEIQRLFGADK